MIRAWISLAIVLMSCVPAAGEDTVCLPLSELNNAAVRLQVCEEQGKELPLLKQQVGELKGSYDGILRDYKAEIEKSRQAEEKASFAPFKNWLWFGAGVLATSGAISLAGRLK